MTFTAKGQCLNHVIWTATGADPSSGTGPTFSTTWSTTGTKTVKAVCPANSSSSSSSGQGGGVSTTVTVVAVDEVIVADSNPEDPGPVNLKLGFTIDLLAKRTPAPATGDWPSGQPRWTITQEPSSFSGGRLLPSTGGRVTFSPGKVGTWKVKAECCDSEDEIEIHVTAGCGWIEDASADKCYERVDSGAASADSPINIVGLRGDPADVVTLTVRLSTGGDPAKVSWDGATQDPTDPLKATVPIGVSTLKKVTVKYDGEDCRQILVWPVWASVAVKISGNLSPDDQSPFLLPNNGQFPADEGGGTELGSIDTWSTPAFTLTDVGGKVEAVASLTPPGVGDIVPSAKLAFRRKVSGIMWENAGSYTDDTWHSQPADTRLCLKCDISWQQRFCHSLA